MPIIEWNEQYLVGNEEIDGQHKRLLKVIKKLAKAIANGDDKNCLNNIIDELSDLMLQHFRTEENFLADRHYPFYKEHLLEHNKITEQFMNVQERFMNMEITASFELLDFLVECIDKHSLETDLKYVHFFYNKEKAGDKERGTA